VSEQRRDLFEKRMPEGYREELLALVSVEPPKPPRRTGSLLLFQLGQLRLALPTKVATAVSPVLHIARIPHRSGTVLLGLVAFRGEIIPCCSLARLLDVARNETGTARMLILEEGPGRLWAVPIDAMIGIRTTPEIHAEDSAPLGANWLSGAFESKQKKFYLLDHQNLFRQITLATA
jgi:chemotaxis signal transduction protein